MLFFCLLEAAFKIHLAQKSEGARALSNWFLFQKYGYFCYQQFLFIFTHNIIT